MAVPALTIRALRTVGVEVPMARPFVTSVATMRAAPLVLINPETEEGITGYSHLFCYVSAAGPVIIRLLEEMLTAVEGDPVAPVTVSAKLSGLHTLIGARGIVQMAMAGFDVACWDALARAAELPLATMLGARPRPIAAYNSNGLSISSPEAAADEAEQLLEDGFKGVKLRLGYPTLGADLAVTRAVRRRLPDDVSLMVDFNQALTRAEAAQRCHALDCEGVSWIEEPLSCDDYAGAAALAKTLVTPSQLGENFVGISSMATAIAARACDYAMLDLARIGGVTGWQHGAGLAAATRMPTSSHLFPEVSAHLLSATPTCHWLEYVDWAAPVLAEPLRIVNGTAVVRNVPGNGLGWNEEAIAGYRAPWSS